MKNNTLDTQKPIFIAGPCSVESEEQIHQTAAGVAAAGASVLRGGIWKPRTRPNSFEGLGANALPWLVAAAKENGLLSTTEVANAEHVTQALKAGVDILWIGARTTVSPFAVQDIADALAGVNIPVMVKNPINPDLDLWIGAIERIKKTGIEQVLAIHRGFSTYEKNTYRNVPNWQIPLDLMRLMPQIPMLCDPSHIAGDSALVAHIAQKAIDLNYAGLMVETHHKPAEALSDKTQQISPEALKTLLSTLEFKHITSSNIEFNDTLALLRSQIDTIDYELLELLAARFKIVSEIGKYKQANKITIFQPERWAYVHESRQTYGQEIKLSEEVISDIIKALHHESIKIQSHV